MVQVGSAQGQGGEIQRNLSRQLGVEKGFWVLFAYDYGDIFHLFQPFALCFFTYAGSELKVDVEYQWGREGGALPLGASMEQDRFGDSRTSP